MSAEASETVTISRDELDSLRAEVRRLRREVDLPPPVPTLTDPFPTGDLLPGAYKLQLQR